MQSHKLLLDPVLMYGCCQTFRNPKPDLLNILRESGPVGDTNGAGATSKPAAKKKSRNVDMEKLAEALPHLAEDDLLQVVQMVHDNKTEDTYTKNDLESGLKPLQIACFEVEGMCADMLYF